MGDMTRTTGKLFLAVREAQTSDLQLDDPRAHARSRARLLQAMDTAELDAAPALPKSVTQPRSRWLWLAAPVAAAACALAIVMVPGEAREAQPIAYAVDGDAMSANQMIVAGERSRELAFSDDTRVELSPHSELRVDALRSNGAQLMLAEGEVSLSVHHEHDTSWEVDAGPWSVHVTGTQFSVAWEPTTAEFAVEVTEGSVRVEGPQGTVAQLEAGDHFSRTPRLAADLSGPSALPSMAPGQPGAALAGAIPAMPEAAIAMPGGGTPEAAIAEPEREAALVEGKAKGKAKTKKAEAAEAKAPSWKELYDEADFTGAWASIAESPGGLHGEANRVSAGTMLDLADLARFNKARGDARQVLERLRERFPGTRSAGEAAFLLGKMAAEGGHWPKAATWFEAYLDEQPKGTHRSDALGRLMASYQAAGKQERAREVAADYLERDPKGAHAAKARELLDR